MCKNDVHTKMGWHKGKRTSKFLWIKWLEEFVRKFELEVLETQRLPILDISLKATPTHWWGTHKKKIWNWYQCKILLHIKFGIEQVKKYMHKYDGLG